MRSMLAVWLVVLALLASGCGKGAAEHAMLAADEAILRVKPEAERHAPDKFAALVASAAAVRAAYDRGNYQKARELALPLPQRADEVLQAAVAALDAMNARWNELRDVLPDQITLVGAKLSALGAMRRPPTFITPEQTEAARRRLAEASEAWSAALRAFNDGDLPAAVAKADSAHTTTTELASLLEPVVVPPG